MIRGAQIAIRTSRRTTISAPRAILSVFRRRQKSCHGERAAISPGGGPPEPIPPNAPPSLSKAASGVPVVNVPLPQPRRGRAGGRGTRRNGGPARRVLLRSGGSQQAPSGPLQRPRSGNVHVPLHGTRCALVERLLRDKNALGSPLLTELLAHP